MPSLEDSQRLKTQGQAIVMLTCYSWPTAQQLEAVGVDVALVGDSLGTTLLGYENTTYVTMNDMQVHTAAVARGISRDGICILADLPCGSYDNPESALENAQVLIDAGAHAVKLEGAHTAVIRHLRKNGIEVCAHLGYLPQTATVPRVQGKHIEGAQELLDQARELEAAGAQMLVLELVPAELAKKISQTLSIPTIGIGAGVHCDGQVQVLDDLLGVSERQFKHAKAYADQRSAAESGIGAYCKDVRSRAFPAADNSSHIGDEVLGRLQ